MSMNRERTRTLDSKVCKNKFITPIPTNIPPRIGLLIMSIQKSDSMIARNRTPQIIPHSTNCWIYQLSGI